MRAALILLLSCPAFASGFTEEDDDFTPAYSVESPDDFTKGKLGILSEALWPRWRAVAFRVLTGPPLDDKSRAALAGTAADDKAPSPVKDWLSARAVIPAMAVPAKLPDAQYGYDYGNCYADSFVTATATLQKRSQRFGAASKEVKEWLGAQDLVFSNCDSESAAIPSEKVAGGVDGSLQKDRDYQVAAAWFYARKFPEARAAFERVAADAGSPWSGYGRFVTARAMIRQATSGPDNDLALLTTAEQRLIQVLADAKAAPLHASARRLVRFIAYRTRPAEQLPALGELLAKSGGGDELDLILTDFSWLADKQPTPERPGDLDPFQKSDLTEWTLAWQLSDSDRVTRALARYHEKKTLPWLLLALASIAPDHAEAKPLLDAARQIKVGTPGYATAAFHRARLLMGQKRQPAARALLDDVLALKDLPREARNRLTDSRYQLARTLDEAIPLMPRTAKNGQPILPAEVNDLFLQVLPIKDSLRLAADARLPALSRERILQAAFLRAALLDDVELAKRVAAQLPPAQSATLADWSAAASATERRNALVHAWLRSGWDLFLYGTASACGTSSPILSAGAKRPPAPAFIVEDAQKLARSESEKIDKLVGNPATFRADQTANWALAHKDDPRVPEDLHLAVNGTKHACDGATATAASKRAWKTLHNLFPTSEWSKKTKYWYP